MRRLQRLPPRVHDLLHQRQYRRAYGWQRDGGMADYMIAEEKDLIALPDELTYADGAQVACGFGTVYEGIEKIGINGNHAVLITGLGPVGLATAALCRKLGASKIIGIDVVAERMKLARDLEPVRRGSAERPGQRSRDPQTHRRLRSGTGGGLLRQRRRPRHRHPRHPQMGPDRSARRRRRGRVQSVART